MDLNKLTVEEVGQLERACNEHLHIWFGFSKEYKQKRTTDFEAATAWRLDGMTEPCCECGEDYPRADLHFHDHIYCPKCRGE